MKKKVSKGALVESSLQRLLNDEFYAANTRRDVRSLRNFCKIVQGVYIHICAYNGGSV